jgi:hypothetical protein
MSTALIVALSLAVTFLGMGWRNSRTENATLRAQIATLKRKLSRLG